MHEKWVLSQVHLWLYIRADVAIHLHTISLSFSFFQIFDLTTFTPKVSKAVWGALGMKWCGGEFNRCMYTYGVKVW